jgi:lipopolysaccharide export system permease protein
MRLIERYLFRQLLGPTLAATAALVGVAILSTSLGQLELIVEYGQDVGLFARMTAYAIPGLLALILPIAIFIACLVALNRLHTEQEIVVCFASGMSRWRVISPAIKLATAAAMLVLALNLFVTPQAARLSRAQLFEVRTDLAATLVREGEFNKPAENLTVYAQRVERDGRLLNVLIHEDRPGKGPRTFAAKEGRVVVRGAAPALILNSGSSEEYDENGVLTFLVFDQNVFDLKPFVNNTDQLHFKISDRYLHELMFPDLRQSWETGTRTEMLAEAHARLSAPLYCIAFVMLALSAVVGGQFSRLGYGRRIIYAAAFAGAARVIAFGAQAACEDNPALNVIQYAIPLGLAYAAYADLFRRRSSGEVHGRSRGAIPLTPVQAPAGASGR